MQLKLYAMRHKKTSRWYKFHELSDDGWGKYYADVNISDYNLPTFFTEAEVAEWDRVNNGMPYEMVIDPTARAGNDRECKRDDVEIISITLSCEG